MIKKRLAFDLDGTITTQADFPNILDLTPREIDKLYAEAKPNKEIIKIINKLSKEYTIYIFTSRGNLHQKTTKDWLKKHKVKFDYFIVDKPFYNALIDDKSFPPKEILKKSIKEIKEILDGF